MTQKTNYYFDNNASTPIHPKILKSYLRYLKSFANPSSLHALGRKARAGIEQARENIALHLNCQPEQIIFTSSGCESNCQIMQSFPFTKDAGHLFYDASAHSSIRNTAIYLQTRQQNCFKIPVCSKGHLQFQSIETQINHSSLISFLGANNETGTLQDFNKIKKIKNKYQPFIHCDAVQLLGKIPLNTKNLPFDFMSFSSHKIYAPKGVGVIYSKNPDFLKPLINGPSHEKSLRAGTENVASIMAFGQAVELINEINHEAIQQLTENLFTQIKLELPNTIRLGDSQNCINNTLCLSFPGINGHSLAMRLDLKGICVSTGSACSVGAIEPSPVLQAMNIDHQTNMQSIRISLGQFNTQQEVDYLVQVLIQVIDDMKKT